MLARRLLSGPKIAFVVGVDAVGDGVESSSLAVALEDGEQFVLAVKAAHRIVADVRGIFQFLRFHNLDRNFTLVRKGERVFEMSARQAGGIGNHGEHLAAEHLMRRPGKKSGVHTTRVGDDQTSVTGKSLAQAFSLLIECDGSVHDIYYPSKSSQFSANCARFDSRGRLSLRDS